MQEDDSGESVDRVCDGLLVLAWRSEDNIVAGSLGDRRDGLRFDGLPGDDNARTRTIDRKKVFIEPTCPRRRFRSLEQLSFRAVSKRCRVSPLEAAESVTQRRGVSQDVDCNRDPAAARQHDVEERRTVTEHDSSIMVLRQREERFGSDCRFDTSAGNIPAEPPIRRDRNMRSKSACSPAADLDKRGERDAAANKGISGEA